MKKLLMMMMILFSINSNAIIPDRESYLLGCIDNSAGVAIYHGKQITVELIEKMSIGCSVLYEESLKYKYNVKEIKPSGQNI